jgi:hypothetical protein
MAYATQRLEGSWPIPRQSRAVGQGREFHGAKGRGFAKRSALISRRRGPSAAPCPTAGDLVLLAEARLVGKPDFYVAGIDTFLSRDSFQTGGETYGMARPSFWRCRFARDSTGGGAS